MIPLVEPHDPATNACQVRQMPTPREGLAAVATTDGRIDIVGGDEEAERQVVTCTTLKAISRVAIN